MDIGRNLTPLGSPRLRRSALVVRRYTAPFEPQRRHPADPRLRLRGTFINDFGTGSAVYTQQPLAPGSQRRRDDHAWPRFAWSSTGPLETTVNQTQFPGFVGVFQNQRRDGTATGTVVVDGVTLVSGPAQSADIETLEDRNTTLP